jgi:hypothetical protein
MIKISSGNTKIGNIPNTSVRPIFDCKGATLCKKKCYALKAWRRYKNVREAWSHNSREWRRSPVSAANSVISWIKTRRTTPKYFRIHVAGDFINQRHLDQWKRVAKLCPATRFRAFTKRFDLDFSGGPSNLLVWFSMWPGVEIPTTVSRTLPLAWMQDGTEDRVPRGALICPGKCGKCMVCWEDGGHKDVVFNEH